MKSKYLAILTVLMIVQLVTLALVLPLAARAKGDAPQAGAPGVISYQGFLTDESGTPLSGQYDLTLGIYTASTGGSSLWDDTFADVDVANGYFSVLLGSGATLSPGVFDGTETWLQVTVNGSATPLPRQRIAAVPYALQAAAAPWSGLSGVPTGFADSVDGVDYTNVIVVAKSGGDYSTIQGAINSITDASDTNRYLVWVAPGVYNETVYMAEYVDIEGAGSELTKIVADGCSTPNCGTLVAASNAEIRFLSVQNTGGAYAVGLYNIYVDSFRIIHATIYASGGSSENIGVYNYDTSVVIVDSIIQAAGNDSYGLRNSHGGGDIIVLNSQIIGGSNTVYNQVAYSVNIAVTQLSGGVVSGTGIVCAGVYDENFTFSANTCP